MIENMRTVVFVVLMFSSAARFETVSRKIFGANGDENVFRNWMEKHNKAYDSGSMYLEKFKIFGKNQILIERLNNEQKTLGSDVEFALNHFADMTTDEFHDKVLMPKRKPTNLPHSKKLHHKFQDNLPKEFDWKTKGIVGEIRDQGDAGTCWAFSTVQTIECQWAMKTGNITELSVEQVVDCDGSQDNKKADCGVFGGWPYLAYDYIKREGGLEKESDYPYCCGLGGDKGTCYVCPAKGYNKTLCGPPAEYCKASDSCEAKRNRSLFVPGLRVQGWSHVSKNETEIAEALVSKGPLSILINAGTLQFYKRGVWDPIICDPTSLDHAVLLTGFGEVKDILQTKKFWYVKNSWGKKWGEDGYFRLARNKGKCGMNQQVTIVSLDD